MCLIGCDIEENKRFKGLIEKESFLKRVYTEKEAEYIKSHASPHKAAAGIFCAKEALAKAIGEGIFKLKPAGIEIYHLDGGKPAARLVGNTLKNYNYSFDISISHTADHTMAVCLAKPLIK